MPEGWCFTIFQKREHIQGHWPRRTIFWKALTTCSKRCKIQVNRTWTISKNAKISSSGPDFFRENHWYFREGGAWSAFASQVIDGVTLGLLSEADSGFRNKLELDSFIYETASAAGFGASFFVGGTGLLKAGKAGSKLNKASKVSNIAKSTVPLTKRRRNLLDALKTNYRPFSS